MRRAGREHRDGTRVHARSWRVCAAASRANWPKHVDGRWPFRAVRLCAHLVNPRSALDCCCVSRAQYTPIRAGMDGKSMTSLRKELKALLRLKRKTEQAQRRQHTMPSIDMQMRTVLVFLLSGSAELARAWAAQEQQRRPWHRLRFHVAVNAAMVGTWANQWAAHATVVDAVQDMQHPWRTAADVFLMESLLVERIAQMSASGLAMSAASAWETYLRYWSYRPQTNKQRAWLHAVDSTPRKRVKYLWRLRRRWGIQCGVPVARPGLSMDLLRNRVRPRAARVSGRNMNYGIGLSAAKMIQV